MASRLDGAGTPGVTHHHGETDVDRSSTLPVTTCPADRAGPYARSNRFVAGPGGRRRRTADGAGRPREVVRHRPRGVAPRGVGRSQPRGGSQGARDEQLSVHETTGAGSTTLRGVGRPHPRHPPHSCEGPSMTDLSKHRPDFESEFTAERRCATYAEITEAPTSGPTQRRGPKVALGMVAAAVTAVALSVPVLLHLNRPGPVPAAQPWISMPASLIPTPTESVPPAASPTVQAVLTWREGAEVSPSVLGKVAVASATIEKSTGGIPSPRGGDRIPRPEQRGHPRNH